MKASLSNKIQALVERLEELDHLLADPGVLADARRYRELSRERAELAPLGECHGRQARAAARLAASHALLQDADPEIRGLAAEESAAAREAVEAAERELQLMLLPRDPDDEADVFLEIRAGTGGEEAALFAADLFRMYGRYAEQRGWRVEPVSESATELKGYRELIARVSGRGVYARLKFESGAHRVQRVPETETQGRIHTSACTVAVLPEAEAVDEMTLNPADLRIDTYRASGAGGQHVNKTDSAIRVTHLPTGVVVECQDERSQHKNRARALALLKARLLAAERERLESAQAQTRRLLVGSGDRSERIRTYNYPQGRVTDHRINLTLYKLEEVLAGNLDLIIEPLVREQQAELLKRVTA